VPTESAELHLEDPTYGDLVFDAVRAGPDDGEPVLLLHGWPQTSLSWEGVLTTLAAEGCSVVAVDQRGYSEGARPGETAAYELPQLVGDAAGFVSALGWESAHVVGHDWGSIVAWALAAQRPELVRSLVAVSVPHPQAFNRALKQDPVQWKKSAYMALFRSAPGKAASVLLRDDASALKAVYGADVAPADVERYLEHFRQDDALLDSLRWYAAMGGDHFKEVGEVAVPTTFVWGSEDVAIGAQAARGCGEWCTGPFEMVVLNGRGHWLPDTDPQPIADAVLAHVRRAG
jgi:pimeloyl-ACP methyl ester carboxylesterase